MNIKAQFDAVAAFSRKYLVAQESKDLNLYQAVQADDAAKVERLIGEGANVNNTRQNPLAAAIDAGNTGMIARLLSHGANANEKIDYWSTTPFIVAARKGDVGVITQLLDAGADINAAGDRGNTALALAVAARNAPLTTLLLDRGANVNTQNRDGWSPLFYAAALNDVDAAKALLAKGARTDRADCDGASVLHVAKSRDKLAVRDVIQAHIDAAVPAWQKLADDKIAHVSIMRGLGYKLTEIFNLGTQQYTAISHNFKTGADSVSTRGFEAADKAVITTATEKLAALKPAAPAAKPQA
ncbi:MAG: ankyrin repeat domain-containing protein [Micavibrio sp.]|nr:ankyrin repeat domain-containing protein [Micavibrio sp.]